MAIITVIRNIRRRTITVVTSTTTIPIRTQQLY